MKPALKSAPDRPFHVLESVDSTNNYAIGAIHDGTARDGETWFAHHQFAGRGQRGKVWTSAPGENITMSLAWRPGAWPLNQQFILSARVALACLKWLQAASLPGWSVKWPNDLYWNDRKAAGMLIENNIQGSQWRFAVIGIGINLNQETFPPPASEAVSLKQITGKSYVPVEMARVLSGEILDNLAQPPDAAATLRQYNQSLFRRNEIVSFRRPDGERFRAKVLGADENGWLRTDAGKIVHGEADWITGDR